jgi:hypothetical protein
VEFSDRELHTLNKEVPNLSRLKHGKK